MVSVQFMRFLDRHMDKFLHFIAGIIVASIAIPIGMLFGLTGNRLAGLALLSSILVGLGKEWWDSREEGTGFDSFDLMSTILGGWVIAGITFLYYSLR